ncbi:MAG: hypothetical protein QXI60_11530 [Thermofilaceae archaeon]
MVEKPFSGAVRWAVNRRTGRSVWLVNMEMGFEESHAKGLGKAVYDALARGEVWAVYDATFRGYRDVTPSNLKTFKTKDEAEEEFMRRVERLGKPMTKRDSEKIRFKKSISPQHMGEINLE